MIVHIIASFLCKALGAGKIEFPWFSRQQMEVMEYYKPKPSDTKI